MEDWRQTKEDAADKRRVRGIARALSTELSERQSLVVASAGHSMWWPPGRTAALPIADEDRTLLGVWLSDGVWDTLAHARMLLTSLDHDYPLEPPQLAKTEAEITGFAPGSSYLSTDPAKFRSAATAIAAALRGLRDEVERLTDEAEAGPARYDGWARAR
jgi:hypothetical protein